MPIEESPLRALEPKLRVLLPPDLYVAAWLDPSPDNLMRVFEHLRTLYRILFDYMPWQVSDFSVQPGDVKYGWQSGAMMFTDLAGFTPLMEAHAIYGQAGAHDLLKILNAYFGTMLEVVSKSGGFLLEFTGDALLVEFPDSSTQNSVEQAVRAGLRMQRAMKRFESIQTPRGKLDLGMRIGIHHGPVMTARIGTPRRMEHVLLGLTIREAKLAEGTGEIGQVTLTHSTHEQVEGKFEVEAGEEGYVLVVDNFDEAELGDYEITAFTSRRTPSAVILDRSVEGIISAIQDSLERVEPLSCHLPLPILSHIVEHVADRRITPNFAELTIVFLTVTGLSERVDNITPEQEQALVDTFSRVFSLTNAAVEANGGVLKHCTYHLDGADMLIYFGTPNAHADDPARAARTALAIRDLVMSHDSPVDHDPLSARIGLASGPVFAAEVGELRGRREWNILGDAVNTAARLMSKAEKDQILMTEAVYHKIWEEFDCDPLDRIQLKGKARKQPVFALLNKWDEIETAAD